uniref:hypothetical protein n=1 Tax=Halobacterium sp. (strain GN101) TaxID=88773 RepID=UPI00159EDC1A|nr:hypothetical protein [Halobacterium sp. GN101]
MLSTSLDLTLHLGPTTVSVLAARLRWPFGPIVISAAYVLGRFIYIIVANALFSAVVYRSVETQPEPDWWCTTTAFSYATRSNRGQWCTCPRSQRGLMFMLAA